MLILLSMRFIWNGRIEKPFKEFCLTNLDKDIVTVENSCAA